MAYVLAFIAMLTVLLRIIAWPVAVAFIAWMLIGLAKAEDVLEPPTPQEYADIQKWIPSSCCWTNNCCMKTNASALTPLDRDRYIVNATHQEIVRSGWSRDGKTWRCTCDLVNGKYVVSLYAKTYCIFPAPSVY